MVRTACLIGLLALSAPHCADADTIRLKNGNVLRGTVVSERDGIVELELPEIGRFTMPRAEIASVEQDADQGPFTHVVTLKTLDTFYGALERETDSDVTMTMPNMGTLSFARAEIASFRPMTPEEIAEREAPPAAIAPAPGVAAPPAPAPAAPVDPPAVAAPLPVAAEEVRQEVPDARPPAQPADDDAASAALAARSRRLGRMAGSLGWLVLALLIGLVSWKTLHQSTPAAKAAGAPAAASLPSRRPKEIPLALPGFEANTVVVKMPSIWTPPVVYVGGQQAPKEKSHFLLRTSSGGLVELEIKPRFFDPVPGFEFGGERFDVVRPLRWYEYVWIGLPIVLMFMGGALGGFCGFLGTYVNARLLRSDLPGVIRFIVTGCVSLATVGAFLLVVGWLHLHVFNAPRS